MEGYYVDTNLIVARYKPLDPLHRESEKLFRRKDLKLYVSPLTFTELYSVLSRARDELETPSTGGHLLETLITFAVKDCGLNVASSSYITERKVADHPCRMPLEYHLSMKFADQLRLRSLDLLHLTYARILELNAFITGDEEIMDRSKAIEATLQIKTLHPKHIT